VSIISGPTAQDSGTSSGEWVVTLDIDFADSGTVIVNYNLKLSEQAADCDGSSQHSRLNPAGGDVAQAGAQNVPVPANQIIKSCPTAGCDDGNACTTDTCDQSTEFECAHPDNSASCDDSNACTTDSCDPASGCVNQPISCDDTDACTTDSCDPTSGCVNQSSSCDDTDACTTDSCSPVLGCLHTPILCADADACTVDSCDAASGCVHTPNPACEDPPTMTTVSCNPPTAQRGLVPTEVSTECTAEVRDLIEAGPFATGTVRFFADGATSPFAACTINGTAQVQTCSVIYRTSVVGPHPIVAIYGGDAAHPISTGATVFTVTLRTVTVRVPSLILASTGLGSPPVLDRPDGRRLRSAWSKAGHSHGEKTHDRARLAWLTAVLPSMTPSSHYRSGSERDIRPPPSDRFSDAFSFRG
jgi:hypothetical protein